VKKTKLSNKQIAFIENKQLALMSKRDVTDSQLAVESGYSESTAHNVTKNVLKPLSENHGDKMTELLDKYLPIEKVLETVKDCMHATKTSRAIHIGEFTDEAIDPDWTARKNATDTALKLRNLLSDTTNVQINNFHESLKEFLGGNEIE
jgi:hypothetical protein